MPSLPCGSTTLRPISRAAVITAPSPSTQLSPAETKASATVYSVVALKTVERCWPQTFGWRLCLGREKKSPSSVALPSSYRIWKILLTQHSSSVSEYRDRHKYRWWLSSRCQTKVDVSWNGRTGSDFGAWTDKKKAVFVGKFRGKRSLGRHRRDQEDNRRTNLWEIGCADVD